MPESPRSVWLIALGSTLIIQIAVSFLSQAMSVLAPSLTEAAGVPPEQIGWLAAIVAIGTVWFLMGGMRFMADVGPIRLLQTGVLLSSFGMLLALFGFWPATLLSALLVGFGYGPAPPAGNQVLMNTAPQKHRALIFSIKQSGAPLGSALAGFLLPYLTNRFSWTVALSVAASLGALTALLVEPYRSRLDARPTRWNGSTFRGLINPRMVVAPFSAMKGSPALQLFAYAGFAFAVVQGAVFALFVTFLVQVADTDLARAGAAFATMQLTGAAARIVVGWISDRVSFPLLVIGGLGLGGSVTMMMVGAIKPDSSWTVVLLLSALAGFCVASWNGVLLSEIAKASPVGQVGQTTSGATFFIFIGYALGPAAFAAIVQKTGSYQMGFSFLEIFPISGTLALWLVHRNKNNWSI